MDILALRSIGLEEKEANAYVGLMRLGSSPASALAKEIGYDRTTTFYLLQRMLERGYVSRATVGRTQTFTATSPRDLQAMLREREALFAEIIPALERLSTSTKQATIIETRQGIEGLHHLYRDAIAAGGELIGFGVDDSKYFAEDPIHFAQYNKEVERGKLKERLLTVEGATVFGTTKSQWRFVPREYFHPAPTIVYGDKVVFVIWEPSITTLTIQNRSLATSFRKHFELLWRMAKSDTTKKRKRTPHPA